MCQQQKSFLPPFEICLLFEKSKFENESEKKYGYLKIIFQLYEDRSFFAVSELNLIAYFFNYQLRIWIPDKFCTFSRWRSQNEEIF